MVSNRGATSGGYAELAVADAAAVHHIGDASADQAVATAGTGRTAMAILELAAPTADDVVLVTAAAGGIGSLLVQPLVRSGATVVGTVGSLAKVDVASELGAHAVDYSGPNWTDDVRAFLVGQRVTLALDGVGGSIGRSSLELVGLGGRVVMYGSASGELTHLSAEDLFSRGISVSSAIGSRLIQRPGGTRDLEQAALTALQDGLLGPIIGRTFPLDQASDAHRAVESRDTIGKTVLHSLG